MPMTALRISLATLCLCILAPLAAPAALAAEPTDAQVDRLIETMDMKATLDGLFAQMETLGMQMGEQLLGDDATPEQRSAVRLAMEKQNASTRRILSWDNLGPIYRKVYRELFTAEEIDAMIAFYGSETGRSILRKTPQTVEMAMQEMQPMLHALVEDMKREIETAAQKP
jgi:hypothetical protein